MIENVKNKTKPKEAQIYHQGLINILVEYQVKAKGVVWKEFLVQNHLEKQTIEEKYKPIQEIRSIMNSPLYPRTRSKKQQNIVMVERGASFISTPGGIGENVQQRQVVKTLRYILLRHFLQRNKLMKSLKYWKKKH